MSRDQLNRLASHRLVWASPPPSSAPRTPHNTAGGRPPRPRRTVAVRGCAKSAQCATCRWIIFTSLRAYVTHSSPSGGLQTASARCSRSRGRVGGCQPTQRRRWARECLPRHRAAMSCPSPANWGALKLGHTLAVRLHDGDQVYRVVGVTKRRVEVRGRDMCAACVLSPLCLLTAACPAAGGRGLRPRPPGLVQAV